MIIEKKPKYAFGLLKVLKHIKQDKVTPTIKFEKELNEKFELLKSNPQMCRKSNYFDDEKYRDLIYGGYTIIYKTEEEKILILEIFKWQNR